jgi:hypothetical protein
MSNGHYLIVSYFLFGLVSLGLGAAAYLVLRRPFAAIADAVAGRFHSSILKRALAVSLPLAAVLGFLSVSYTQRGCSTYNYEQVINDRSYLVEVNQQQLQHSSEWVVYVVFASGVVVLICLVILRKKEEGSKEQ